MIHPHTELRFINNEIGYGVVATEFIPAGTITWVQDKLDREFLPEEVGSLDPIYQSILDTYTFRNRVGNYILCWDNARYVNHSFNSNCLTTAYDFEIAVRARLDIGSLPVVADPGRMPGMKPPYFFMLSATSAGLNVIAT